MISARVVVLGGGPGGYAAAFLAADLGLETVVIDEGTALGGVCLNRGCIPSKALLHLARVINDAADSGQHGVRFGAPEVDLARVRAWKDEVVEKLTGGLKEMAGARKVNWVRGRGKFAGSGKLVVEGTGEIGYENAIIATGSLPQIPPLFRTGDKRIWDSTAALALTDLPKKLLVVGGGYIGLELGSVYAALGSKVTVVEMTPGLLPGADPDLVRPLAARLAGKFESIMLSTKVTGLAEGEGGRLRVTLESPTGAVSTGDFDRILVSAGRRPNTTDLGLETVGLLAEADGFIKSAASRKTSAGGIYVIGDAAGQPMLAHKAAHEARVAVECITGHDAVFAPRAIPAVVFTDPEIAWCGLTEPQARAEGRTVKVARFPWAASGRAATLGRTEGLTKLVVDPETERILGVGIVGAGAGELISEGVLAMETGATVSDLALTIHPHPTLSETLMESAEVYHGLSTHLLRPRKG